jgi:pilus assembly protein Flp/PilA
VTPDVANLGSGMSVAEYPFAIAASRCCRGRSRFIELRVGSNDARRNIMLNLIARFRALLRDDKGQDLIEYALLAGLIALVAVVAIGNAGTEVNAIWEDIVTALQNVP